MSYRVEIRPAAQRDMKKLPPDALRQIYEKLTVLADDPRAPGCVKLRGKGDIWRLRSGDYRVIYEIHDQLVLVLVMRVGHRREVYRRR